jgi:hypothetical protein
MGGNREAKRARREAGEQRRVTYQYLGALHRDPLNIALDRGAELSRQLAETDYLGLGRTAGQQAAGRQSTAITSALAGRGGGNLGQALGLGAQARVGAELGGLQQGLQARQQGFTTAQNILAQALGARWNAITALLAQQAGVSASTIQAQYGYTSPATKIGAAFAGGLGSGGGAEIAKKF